MILSILHGLWTLFVNTVIDGLVYLIVDYFVKAAIRNASSEEEKGVIWLGECILLLVISILMYVSSHTPYLILIMVALTLAFTQIRGQVNLVYWWYQLLSRWDEFKLHEQSMEEFNKRRSQAPPPPSPLRNIPQNTDPPDYPRPFHVSARKPLRQDNMVYANAEPLYQRYQPQPLVNQHQPQPRPDPPKIMVKQTTSFTSKIKSVLGMGAQIPPGLKNNGQNLCFMNAILQCVARSPGLVDGIDWGAERDGCSFAESQMVQATRTLLKQLLNPTDYRLLNNVDTTAFRKAASDLQPTMIAPPNFSNPAKGDTVVLQRQQDAAELLMWLLDTMHDSMNQIPAKLDPRSPLDLSNLSPESLSTWNHLIRKLGGTPSINNIVEVKNKYMREIEVSSGMDRAPETLQRLADLEWILHRIHNRSAWSHLFSGQLVECQHCLACSRLSVGIQTFTVLPVPIVDPRKASGFVYLEDCFGKFTNTENLFGKEGLCCPCSNPAKRTSALNSWAKTPVRSRVKSADSAVHSPGIGQSGLMSPIPSVGGTSLNDSGFPDQYRTSTPIAEGPILTNGQRRALLRQLPECFVIQLMRFRYNQRYHDQYKVHTPVHIPLHGLALGSMIFDDDPNREEKYMYELYGMCLHLGAGTTQVGHYVAYCTDSSGAWWKLDDEEVCQVNMDFELNSRLVRENAYVLFYKRK